MRIAPVLRRVRPQHNGGPHRRGYTLLETIFAVGLSVLLMAAIVSAIEMYRRASTAGRDEVERSQIARALLRAIEADVRSCAFQAPASDGTTGSQSGSSSGGGSSSGSASGVGSGGSTRSKDEVITVSVDPGEAYTDMPFGVVGDANVLQLYVLRSSRTAAGRDARVVAWFLAAPGAGGLGAAVSSAASVAGIAPGGTGLARLDGDPAVVDYAVPTGDLETLAAQARLLAPEVTAVGFRYFDGTQWLTAWDSVASERLPNAVEVEVAIGNSGMHSPPGTTGTGSTRLYRIVIDLPASEPVAVRSATESP